MFKVSVPVNVIKVHARCTECPEGGEYISSGSTLDCNPPLYGHKCDNCGHTCVFPKAYPHIEYVPVGEARLHDPK
jgi:hypothetical protein